jgi:hypothetical protein
LLKGGSTALGSRSSRGGPDRGELTVARRFFANATDAERDLIAYWQMVKLVEDAYVRYTGGGDA